METTGKKGKPKLIDIIKNSMENSDEFLINTYVAQAEISSSQTMLEIKKEINEEKNKIKSILSYDPGSNTTMTKSFSLSNLYVAETRKRLLEEKLVWMESRVNDLF